MIVSVDGRGAVTRHAPREGALASMVPGSNAVPLDHSYVLDDAPAFERFFLITSTAPFRVEPVVEAVRRLADAGGARAGAPPSLRGSPGATSSW